MIYLDSSALVKRYIEEAGSDTIESLLANADVVVVSRLAYPETLSAITRRHRAGDISDNDFKKIKQQFKSDWQVLTIVEIRNEVLQFIDRVIEKYALRGADSIHLSSVIWLKQAMKTEVVFVASDIALVSAAKQEKLAVINPEQDEKTQTL